jgi:L-amino acid N-acyltransferase YncA
MTSRELEAEIDRLYQLPLGEFTAARQALAKRADKGEAARVKALQKPNVAAWAVNQLYWRARPAYDRLVQTAERVRTAHRAAVSGRGGDVRDLDAAHRDAVSEAMKETLHILKREGHPASSATEQAVGRTIEALPADAAPGRLVETLEPPGFEILAGLRLVGGRDVEERLPPTARRGAAPAKQPDTGPSRTELAQLKKAVERAVRESEAAARAAKENVAELARADRALEQARKDEARAEAALDQAQQALERARERTITARQEADRQRRAAREAEGLASDAEATLAEARAALARQAG